MAANGVRIYSNTLPKDISGLKIIKNTIDKKRGTVDTKTKLYIFSFVDVFTPSLSSLLTKTPEISAIMP